MLSTLLVYRFLKFIAVAAFFAGIVGTFGAKDPDERRRWADRHAAPGFVLTWILGTALATTRGDSLVSRWIVGAVIASSIAIWATLAQAHLVKHQSRGLAMAGSLAFVATLALMVFRP